MADDRTNGVFVGSVYDELKEYRKAAIDAIWRCKLHPIAIKFKDIAKPESTITAYLRMIDQAAVFIGIFGRRYGTLVVEGLRHAQKRGMPILIFLADASLNEGDVESDPGHAEDLDQLKDELRQTYTIASFHTSEDLGDKVFRSLSALHNEGKVHFDAPKQSALGRVFISYRRADSATFTGRIYDRLVMEIGRSNVFKDVDDIPAGVDFAQYIQDSLRQCAAALVVIGPQWLKVRGVSGSRRLNDSQDFVRLEIETAFRLRLSVIPLLVDGAVMPAPKDLPEPLRPLVKLNALQVRNDPDFARDMEHVIAGLDQASKDGASNTPPIAMPSVPVRRGLRSFIARLFGM